MANKTTYPVRPIIVWADGWVSPTSLTKQTVSSRTAAVSLCRNLGYRVLTVGGKVELVKTGDPANSQYEWQVTVCSL